MLLIKIIVCVSKKLKLKTRDLISWVWQCIHAPERRDAVRLSAGGRRSMRRSECYVGYSMSLLDLSTGFLQCVYNLLIAVTILVSKQNCPAAQDLVFWAFTFLPRGVNSTWPLPWSLIVTVLDFRVWQVLGYPRGSCPWKDVNYYYWHTVEPWSRWSPGGWGNLEWRSLGSLWWPVVKEVLQFWRYLQSWRSTGVREFLEARSLRKPGV